jgi:hypothetical protein
LFSQPDFTLQKSHLEEYITSHGHICDFYPKFHCELNFIEQYWGAAKFQYQTSQRTCDMDAMERNVLSCLDDVPLLPIQRYLFSLAVLVCTLLTMVHNADMQIDLRVSFPRMYKVLLVARQLGLTVNTMDIALYPPL